MRRPALWIFAPRRQAAAWFSLRAARHQPSSCRPRSVLWRQRAERARQSPPRPRPILPALQYRGRAPRVLRSSPKRRTRDACSRSRCQSAAAASTWVLSLRLWVTSRRWHNLCGVAPRTRSHRASVGARESSAVPHPDPPVGMVYLLRSRQLVAPLPRAQAERIATKILADDGNVDALRSAPTMSGTGASTSRCRQTRSCMRPCRVASSRVVSARTRPPRALPSATSTSSSSATKFPNRSCTRRPRHAAAQTRRAQWRPRPRPDRATRQS